MTAKRSVVLGCGSYLPQKVLTNAEGFAYAVDVGYEMVRCDLLTKISALVQAQIAQEVVS